MYLNILHNSFGKADVDDESMVESARIIAEKLTSEGYLGPLVKSIERRLNVEGFTKSLDTNPDVFAFKDKVGIYTWKKIILPFCHIFCLISYSFVSKKTWRIFC